MIDKYTLAALPFSTLDRLGLSRRPATPFSYVVERANWSTRWDGTYVQREIEKREPGLSRIVDVPANLTNSAVHFFSHHQWQIWCRALAPSNRYAVTFYHGKREDGDEEARQVDAFMGSLDRINIVVTAASLIEDRLKLWGVPAEKIVRIPIPINLDVFRPVTAEQRENARTRYGIPDGHIAIGSFQKDGNGWGDGREAKLIKGPDVLIETVAAVAKHRPAFVVLTGPARGYVKAGLDRLGIPYSHDFVDDYEALPDCYAALDVYLNPSREEGGPKGVMESMASGIPIVSTRVGMAPDLVVTGRNGFLIEVGDANSLAAAILEVAENAALRKSLVVAAREDVRCCDVSIVGAAHHTKVVKPLLAAMGRDR